MPLMGRPKTTHEYAEPGQYQCLFRLWDRERERWVLCGDEVPEGELTTLAHNTRSVTFLALCVKHRQALAESVMEYMTAGIGQGTIAAAREELSGGRLVSHSKLREALIAHSFALKNGPLTEEQRLKGVELLFGPDERAYVESKLST